MTEPAGKTTESTGREESPDRSAPETSGPVLRDAGGGALRELGPDARAVLDVFQSIGTSLDLGRTADHFLTGLGMLIRFDAASLVVREWSRRGRLVLQRSRDGRETSGRPRTAPVRGILGTVLDTGRATLVPAVNEPAAEQGLRGTTRSAMAAPVIGAGGRPLGAVLVESDAEGLYHDGLLEMLMGYARAAATSIERALLYFEMMENRRFEGELDVARQVMAGLLPSEAPRLQGFDIAAVIEPCYEVGGDYYDFIALGDDRWGLALADVSGKGVPAALVVAAMRASLYSLAKRELALRAVLRHANDFIHVSTGPRSKYVTLFYAVLDVQARRCIYINAGHLPPVVMRAGGEVELLRSGGFPLGFFDNPRYFEQFVQLRSGDLLCLYTDGITEATNANDDDYGRSRLIELLRANRERPANELCDAVLADVRRFSGRAPADDATVLIIKAT